MLILSDSLKLYKVGENGLEKDCAHLGQRCTNNSLVELGPVPQFMAKSSTVMTSITASLGCLQKPSSEPVKYSEHT